MRTTALIQGFHLGASVWRPKDASATRLVLVPWLSSQGPTAATGAERGDGGGRWPDGMDPRRTCISGLGIYACAAQARAR
jgi:hypothetical protein